MAWLRRTAGQAPRRGLGFESLETRRLMAVTTALNNGSLTITGDTDADDVAIVGTMNPGEITVTGRNGTEVNGMANGSTTISGVTGFLIVELGDGDNVVNLDNVYLAKGLQVTTGNGNDQVILGASGVVSSAEGCDIRTGGGNDVVRAEDYNVLIAGLLEIHMNSIGSQGGRDFVSLNGASSLFWIRVSGISNDVNEFVLRGVTSAGPLDVDTAGCPITNLAIFNSSARRLVADFDAGQNSIYFDTVFVAGFTRISSASFNHSLTTPSPPVAAPYNIDTTVTIARSQMQQIIVITGGEPRHYFGGNDRISLVGNSIVGPADPHHNFPFHVVYVETGDGNDVVDAAYNVALGDWFASFSQMDDTYTLAGNLITGFASADGGTGRNRLNNFGNQFGGFAATRF